MRVKGLWVTKCQGEGAGWVDLGAFWGLKAVSGVSKG
jgi:hypothetical protein